MEPYRSDELMARLDKLRFFKSTITNEQTGELIQVDTIFDKFLRQQLRSYIEPVRKGTPKGQLIGLSIQKYVTSLLMLTNLSVKKIAAGLKLKYGVVLVWRTEDAFKKQVLQHCNDFADFLVKELIEEKKIHELGYWEARAVLEELEAEFKFYSPLLNDAIEKAVAAVEGAGLEAIKDGKIGLSSYFLELKYGKEVRELEGDVFILTTILTSLKKPNLSRRDKANLISELERYRNSKAKLLPDELRKVWLKDNAAA